MVSILFQNIKYIRTIIVKSEDPLFVTNHFSDLFISKMNTFCKRFFVFILEYYLYVVLQPSIITKCSSINLAVVYLTKQNIDVLMS